MKLTKYLIVKSNGDMRITARYPALKRDEILYRVEVIMPDTWGRQIGTITLELPDQLPSEPILTQLEPEA